METSVRYRNVKPLRANTFLYIFHIYSSKRYSFSHDLFS
nr:MAG TPA: hypothetical protein [Caudoviricetes sp.]